MRIYAPPIWRLSPSLIASQNLGVLSYRRGDRAGPQAALAALIEDYGDKSHYQHAQIHAQWGDRPRALAALQKAWQLRDSGIMLMYNDPLLDPLRDTPGYRALDKHVGFIYAPLGKQRGIS